MPDDATMRFVYIGLLVLALGAWGMVEMRRNFGRLIKTLLAWAMIFVGLMAVYGLWGDITRSIHPGQQTGSAEVTLPRAADGHYYAQLQIGGKTVQFMVDTGASDVVLSPADARTIGITPADLVYIGQASTANGIVRTARVSLKDVQFGPFADAKLGVSVNEAPMEISLLGMDYLGRFQISIAGDQMVLRR